MILKQDFESAKPRYGIQLISMKRGAKQYGDTYVLKKQEHRVCLRPHQLLLMVTILSHLLQLLCMGAVAQG